MPVGVDAGRDQGVHRHHPAALADLEDQRVGGHERERAAVSQRSGAELLDVLVELVGHHRDLRLRQPGDAQGLHQLVHPPGRDPEQVAGRHHAGQRPLGALAPLQEPLGEVGALAQLGDRDVEGAGAGVEVAVPVAVAAVDPLRADATPYSAPQTASASAESSVLMNVPSSSRSRSGLAWASCSSSIRAGSILGSTVIVVSFFESVFADHSKDHAVAVAYFRRHAHRDPYTTLLDSRTSAAANYELVVDAAPLYRPTTAFDERRPAIRPARREVPPRDGPRSNNATEASPLN